MNFNMELTENYYRPAEIAQYERLGFKFEQIPIGRYRAGDYETVPQSVHKEFATLEELLAFVDNYGGIIIQTSTVYKDGKPTDETEPEIEIYNGYRE